MMYQFSPVSLPSPQFLSFFRFRRLFWGLSGEIEFSLTPCGFAGKIPLKYEVLQALQGFQYRVLISSKFHQSPFGREHSKSYVHFGCRLSNNLDFSRPPGCPAEEFLSVFSPALLPFFRALLELGSNSLICSGIEGVITRRSRKPFALLKQGHVGSNPTRCATQTSFHSVFPFVSWFSF